jgi:hypothetical protein
MVAELINSTDVFSLNYIQCSAGVTCTWRRKLVCLRLFPSTFTILREYAVNLFFFLRREMREAHLPDYPAAPCVPSRLHCCTEYIHEVTMLHCVYPRDEHVALCPHEIALLQCVFPRDGHAALCVATSLPWCTVCFHEITMLRCVYPRDYHAALCVYTR